MTKYKEQPAFETNEFKVGDLVKVYYGSSRYEAFVDKIFEDETMRVLDSNDGCSDRVHFKQCRLLKKVEPREFDLYETDSRGVYTNDFTKRKFNSGVIRVREVLDDSE